MATFSGNKFDPSIIAVTGDGKGGVINVTSYYTHPTASTKLTDGDLVKLVKIPAGHRVVGLNVFSGDLDAGTALVVDVGLLKEGDAALETVFVSGSTLGQAGGTLAVPATTTMFTTAGNDADRILAVEVTTSAGTKGAADAIIGVSVNYAPV